MKKFTRAKINRTYIDAGFAANENWRGLSPLKAAGTSGERGFGSALFLPARGSISVDFGT
jgi:hypothetical protein